MRIFKSYSSSTLGAGTVCMHAGVYNDVACSHTQSACLGCYCDALLYAAPVSDLGFCPGQLVKVLRVQVFACFACDT